MSQFDWLLAAFAKTVFTAFDTETSGLEPKLNRVVEAGAIRFDAMGISARFNALINPKVPMPLEVTKINGITDAMLINEPDAQAILPDFLSFIGESVLIAHNAPFDVAFINEELSRIGRPPLSNRVIDTRIFAKELFPGLPKYSLQELASRFGIKAVDAHRAEDDARVCMELFLVCLARLREMNPDSMVENSSSKEAAAAISAISATSISAQGATASRIPISGQRAPDGASDGVSVPNVQNSFAQDDLFAEEDDIDDFSGDDEE